MASAVIYLRVSTQDQGESGAGLAAQEDACRAFARAQGLTVALVATDSGVSGATGLDKRPGLLDGMGQLGAGDVLLVAKRDRLGRDPLVLAMIEAATARKGARVISVAGEGTGGDAPTDVLMRRLIDAFAEYERLVIKARTRAALQAKKRRGERVGQLPYGFRLEPDGRTLTPDGAQLDVLDQIRAWRASGLSLRAIAQRLTLEGVPTCEGSSRWAHQSVAALLKRPA